jgi:hypothetical protein
MSSLIHKLNIKIFNFACLLACLCYILLLLLLLLLLGFLTKKYVHKSGFLQIIMLPPILRKWVCALEHSFIFVGGLIFNFSLVLLSLMIIIRWVG